MSSSLRFLYQLQWNSELPTATQERPGYPHSMQDEAQLPCINSQAIPVSLLKLERRLDFFYATLEVP